MHSEDKWKQMLWKEIKQYKNNVKNGRKNGNNKKHIRAK